MVQWYHEILCHPGSTRTEDTIAQHFYWEGMRKTVRKTCGACDQCQRTKRYIKKYGKLPVKQAEIKPWQTLCVDLIGPYKIGKKNKQVKIWAITMIDPATGWIEMVPIETKRADVIANLCEQRWLTRYPRPDQVIYDRGTEFMAEFSTMLERDYDITKKPITVRNPQANSIVERVHLTMGNMLRTYDLPDGETTQDQIPGILAAISFGIRSTIHTTMRATPMQLVFGRDSILNVQHLADWKYIQSRKQKMIVKNNIRENAKRTEYVYDLNELVLLKRDWSAKYGTTSYDGPYPITKINDNGTVQLQMDNVYDTVNLRNIKPYQTKI